jgi:pimeloyl-ACP methyl ester carboxylesterase
MVDLTRLSELLERNENFVSSTKYFDGSIQLNLGKEKIWIKAFMGMGLEDSGAPSYSDQGYLSGLSACGSKAEKERVAEIVWTRRLGDPKIYYSDLKAWIHHDLRPSLPKISCPVFCVWGNEDYFVPRPLVEETVAGISNSRLEVLDGIGHYPHLETREFNPLVERFLQSLGIGKGKWPKN